MSIVNLQSDPIFVRSPYIITIDEPSQIEAQIDIWVWNNLSSPPVTPTYRLSKKIPSSTNLQLDFNISHYAREGITFPEESDLVFNTSFVEIPENEWVFVKVKRYTKYNGDTAFTPLDTKTYIALDGYGYYEDRYNPVLSNVLLAEGTYEYYYDPNTPPAPLSHPYNNRYGDFKIVQPQLNDQIRYTDLKSGLTYIVKNLSVPKYVTQSFLVYPNFIASGNLVEYLDASNNVLWSCTMKPTEECKYNVNAIDFVNRYGAWQRTFGFKASRKTLSVTTEEHDLFNRSFPDYNIYGAENKLYNVNGRKKIKLNTGWVGDESYNDLVLQPMMLSERIQINQYAVKMETRSTELFENINQSMINYELTFEYAYDVINNVV